MAIAKLLSHLGLALRKGRPLVPASCGYRIVVADAQRHFAQIWLRTRGCRHDILNGGCTICNYWASTEPQAEEMVAAMGAALDNIAFEAGTIVLSASGSFLDPWEIAPPARRRILELLRARCPRASVIIETHHNTVTPESIAACSEILGPRWTVEMGLESSSRLVLRCCINKPLTPDGFLKTIKAIRLVPGLSSIANVALGAPFLSGEEIIADAVATVTWALGHGVDECVLFPMNLKPHTLAYWLHGQRLYQQPSLWVLADVLAALPAELLPRVNFAWHRVDRGQRSEWDEGIIAPMTCPDCYPRVMELLEEYLADGSRGELVQALQMQQCPCRDQWNAAKHVDQPLGNRLLQGYERATVIVLGRDYWARHGMALREELQQLLEQEGLPGLE